MYLQGDFTLIDLHSTTWRDTLGQLLVVENGYCEYNLLGETADPVLRNGRQL